MAFEDLMDWDSVIEDDGQEFVLLPEGDYTFKVTKFERGHHNGSNKIPACNKAIITLQIKSDKGTAVVTDNLFLYKTVEWRLSQFFRAIGQKTHGQKLRMNWEEVPGSDGRVHIGVREWTGNDGNTHKSNEVVRYIDAKVDKEGFREMPENSSAVDDLPF